MLARRNPQLNAHGELIHLLSIEGLPRAVLTQILDTAGTFLSVNDRDVKKVPLLRGKSVFNLFFENSTRTRTTFEIAAKRLSADVINLDIARSSTAKGESLLDTIANLSAMHADMFVVRHSESGAPYLIARHCAPHVHVVNAGDGRHAHPTQGLLDMYTIRHYKKSFTDLTVAIVGDIVHSRVARSDIHALTTLGVPEIRAVGPKTLVPDDLREMGVRVCRDMAEGVRGADVIIMLRLQNERMAGAMLRRLRLGWESVRSEVERELEIEEIRRSAKEAAERADAMRKAADAELHSAHASVNKAVAEVASVADPVQGNATSAEARDGD